MSNTKMQLELGFDFYKTLYDADGDKVIMPTDFKKEITISSFLRCGKKQAMKVLADLEKEYDVYCNWGQIVLAKGDKCLFNFEECGQSYGTELCPHKYNTITEWDFRDFVNGKKLKTQKQKRSPKITITCTEMQLKRAQQLWYAYQLGFDVTWKDYKRFYLVEQKGEKMEK